MASKGKFQSEIADELGAIIAERGLENVPSSQQKGKAFEYWCLELLGRWHSNVDNDPAEIPDSGDGGVDILLEDTAGKRFLLAQCAYVGKGGRFNIDKWKRLCALADDLLDEDRMAAGAYGTGEETRAELARVSRLLNEAEYSVDLFYMTTATASEDHHETANALSRSLGSSGVKVELWDQLRLRRIRDETEAVEATSVDEFRFDIPNKQYFSLKTGTNDAHVLAVNASTVAQRYDQWGQRLLAWNIRSYLGANTINNEIRASAESRPEEFFLCNNGITAIAREVHVEETKLHTTVVCKKFQVINGGQTLASLTEVLKDKKTRHLLSEIPILFTVIQTSETSPTSPFNRRVIQARNTQNKVYLSDFRSNDSIQQWLEHHLPSHAASILPGTGPGQQLKCRNIFYKPKRDSKRKKSALKLQLEDLAKVRYAYLYEPWTVLAYVNQLWTKRGEETAAHPGKRGAGRHDASGKYELAFGDSDDAGREALTWQSHDLTHCVFAVVVHEFIKHETKERLITLREKEQSGTALSQNEIAQTSYLMRARFHGVALAGVAYRETQEGALKKLMKDPSKLQEALAKHWARCLIVFRTHIDPRLEDVGRDTVLRGPRNWDAMVETYKELLDL